MSKKKILILILGLVLLFFHICTFAFSDVISKIVSKHESKLKIGDDIQSITKKEDLPDNLVKDLEITAKESEDLENQVIDIVSKFYPERLSKILNDIDNSSSGSFVEGSPQIELCNLILDVIEYSDLTVEEEKFLNDLMIELSDNFNDFPELQSRIENVCK